MVKEETKHYVTIFETSNRLQWQIVRDLLVRNAIPHRAFGGSLTGAHIGMGQHTLTHRLETFEDYIDQALDLIEEHLDEISEEGDNGENWQKIITRPTATPSQTNEPTIEVRRIGPLSLALITTLLGLLVYVFWQLWNVIIYKTFDQNIISNVGGLLVGSFGSGLLTAWLYNLVARWVGGIQISIFDVSRLLSTNFTAQQCFYRKEDDSVEGPLSLEELHEHVKAGNVVFDTPVQIGSYVNVAGRTEELETAFFLQDAKDDEEEVEEAEEAEETTEEKEEKEEDSKS